MKRSDLKVGGVYAYRARRNGWPDRAEVLTLEPLLQVAIPRASTSFSPATYPVTLPDGSTIQAPARPQGKAPSAGVLVRLHERVDSWDLDSAEQTTLKVVALGALIGDYEQVMAQERQTHRERTEQSRRAQDKTDRAAERINQALSRLQDLIPDSTVSIHGFGALTGRVVLDVEVLEDLLARAEVLQSISADPVPELSVAFERARTEILRDVRAGTVPADVPDFVSLDTYVDRNVYGGVCDPTFAAEERFPTFEQWVTFCAALENSIDTWITSGGVVRDSRQETR